MSSPSTFQRTLLSIAVLGACGISQNVIAADDTQNILNTAPVVVTATRVEANSFDLPVSIDVVDAETIQAGQLQANISESLARVPGIVAVSRGQSAQDIQISTRGFGARSQFGVRGIRLYADGIPLTMPDGQGQAGTFDLGSAKSIEVMRGPFSTLYGNSSGGVVQIFTADGPKDPTLTGSYTTGSYSTNRESLKIGGTLDAFNYNIDLSHLESNGYRAHSAVRKDLFNAKLGIQLNENAKLTIIATDLDQPISQDPQGLSKSSWLADPKQVVAKTNVFNTRVSKSQTQFGAKLDYDLDNNNTLNFMVYGGNRDNLQYQSTFANAKSTTDTLTTNPIAIGYGILIKDTDYVVSTNNGSAGGVAKIKRDFYGTDLRLTHKGDFLNGAYNISIGANFDTMTDARTGYDNFTFLSAPSLTGTLKGYTCGINVTCGVIGILRRDENNTAWNSDQYAQADWSPSSRWNLVTGLRHNNVHLQSKDHYIANGDGSGSTNFSKTTAVAGAVFKFSNMVNLYANVGQGFETPSLVEMAYLPGGNGGFNTNLRAATSNNYEVGAKAFVTANTRATLAVFKTNTENEIVVADSTNGRSSYQNAGGTKRNGLEITIDSDFGHGLAGFASYAYLDAKYADAFCSGSTQINATACNLAIANPSLNTATGYSTKAVWVNSNKAIPGTYRETAYAELSWKYKPYGFTTAIEERMVSKTYVSDKTTTDFAPGYGITNWRAGFSQALNKWRVSEFVRVENIFDRNYVGSVKVNDASTQFYEPGNGRNWLVGINASSSF